MGSNFAAFLAGYTPKMRPKMTENRNDPVIGTGDITTETPETKGIPMDINMPKRIPKTPPAMLTVIDSIKNCVIIIP